MSNLNLVQTRVSDDDLAHLKQVEDRLAAASLSAHVEVPSRAQVVRSALKLGLTELLRKTAPRAGKKS